MPNINDLKKLRQKTGAGINDIRQALDQTAGDAEKALQLIRQQGLEKSAGKAGRGVGAGLVEVYSHSGRVGVVVELLCETDFVAKTADFKTLAHELALQIAAMNPSSVEGLLSQVYIRDGSQTIADLVKSIIGRLGENIVVGRFERVVLGG